jgi:hypothetical protein
MLRLSALFAIIAALSLPAGAQECRQLNQNRIVGQCSWVRGRYNIYADGDGIWIVHSHRRLSVVDDELDQKLQARGWEDWSAFANFRVCPLSPFVRGHMQSVCIEDYKNLRFEPWTGH